MVTVINGRNVVGILFAAFALAVYKYVLVFSLLTNNYLNSEVIVLIGYVTDYISTCGNCECIKARISLCRCLVVRLSNDLACEVIKSYLSVVVAALYPVDLYCCFISSCNNCTVDDSTVLGELCLTTPVKSCIKICSIRERLLGSIHSELCTHVHFPNTAVNVYLSIGICSLCCALKTFISCIKHVCTLCHNVYVIVNNCTKVFASLTNNCCVTGSCSCGKSDRVLKSVSRVNHFLALCLATSCASLVSIVTVFRTCSSLFSYVSHIVTESLALCFAAFALLGFCASCVRPYVHVRRNVVGVLFAAFALTVNKLVLVRRNVIGVLFAAFALAVNEVVLVRSYVVRICCATYCAFAFSIVMTKCFSISFATF